MKKVCDICGETFVKGLKVKDMRYGTMPWNKKIYVCDKCEHVLKMLVLSHRRVKPV